MRFRNNVMTLNQTIVSFNGLRLRTANYGILRYILDIMMRKGGKHKIHPPIRPANKKGN